MARMKSFDIYKKLENEKFTPKDLRIDHSALGGIESIIGIYEDIFLKRGNSAGEDLKRIEKELKKTNYNIKTIEKFCKILDNYQNKQYFYLTGHFLNIIMNDKIKDGDKVDLDFTSLNENGNKKGRINYVGYKLDKEIELNIYGDVKDYLGMYMKKGSINLHGNARHYVGNNMYDGDITIYENAGQYCGIYLIDGRIKIYGNVEKSAGYQMTGGKVFIEKNAGDNTGEAMRYGTIIVKGNTGRALGKEMSGGKIIVDGYAKSIRTGYAGEIHVNGDCGRIFSDQDKTEYVKIYLQGEKIWPR